MSKEFRPVIARIRSNLSLSNSVHQDPSNSNNTKIALIYLIVFRLIQKGINGSGFLGIEQSELTIKLYREQNDTLFVNHRHSITSKIPPFLRLLTR